MTNQKNEHTRTFLVAAAIVAVLCFVPSMIGIYTGILGLGFLIFILWRTSQTKMTYTVSKKRKNRKRLKPFSRWYMASAVIVGLSGFITPLVNFEVGVAGFILLLIWLSFTIKKMWSNERLAGLSMIMFVLIASHRLLAYAFMYFYFLPCQFSTCNFG